MSWALLILVVLLLGIAFSSLATRRWSLHQSREVLGEIVRAKEQGSDKARLQYPVPDLARCIGCATCVAACPEEGVLEVVHGQARVVHGSRCVGHGRCAAECPVGAIALTLGDISNRRDIPALTTELEVAGTEGLYLAGEVTGFALIRTAIEHGTNVAREVAQARKRTQSKPQGAAYDLVIIGAGPAGLACALESKRLGLRAVILEQEKLGGTVAQYPRRKLVMTQPVHLPLHGKLARTSYSKEELMELWHEIVDEQQIEIPTECEFKGCHKNTDGTFQVESSAGPLHAGAVCIAVGRRGTPRKLGVPGEDGTQVAYSLIDAQNYTFRRVLVVGGGDSAVEAAIGLAHQPGNQVTLSYRRHAFNRLKARNVSGMSDAIREKRIECIYESQVLAIQPGRVLLSVGEGASARQLQLDNDDVFILAGGIPPFALLENCGVSLDPADRPQTMAVTESGDGLVKVLGLALALALVALLWTLYFRSYYALPGYLRLDSEQHQLLNSASGLGLGLGVVGTLLVLANLSYLARRSPRIPFFFGSLQKWMNGHVLTGLLSLLAIIGHSAMLPKQTVGGHAFACLALLILTGAIGRYFYSFVPHAANGRELRIDEVRKRYEELTAEWSQQRSGLAQSIGQELDSLIHTVLWQGGFLRRVVSLIAGQRKRRQALRAIDVAAQAEGLSPKERLELRDLAIRAHREAQAAAHYEELRGIVSSWRYFHRWIALLMVGLVAIHIVTALRFAELFAGGS